MHVDIILFDGFDTLDAIGPFEVFGHARSMGAPLEISLVTVESQSSVHSSHGLEVVPDGFLTRVGDDDSLRIERSPDLVIVPGGGWRVEDGGVRQQVSDGRLPSLMRDLHRAGSTIASVCTGAMVLAEAGLTDGRPAITHRSAIDDLRDSGAEIVDSRVVDDGDLVTAGGITAGIDLALHLLEREFDEELSTSVAAVMEYEAQGSAYQT